MKCSCPVRCRYCGRQRSRDAFGHYCKTRNCQWQHGYATCPAPTARLSEGERIEQMKTILAAGPLPTPQIRLRTRDNDNARWGLAMVLRVLRAGPFERVQAIKPGGFRVGLKTTWRLKEVPSAAS